MRKSHQRTKKAMSEAIRELEKSQDIELKTPRNIVINYLDKKISETYGNKEPKSTPKLIYSNE